MILCLYLVQIGGVAGIKSWCPYPKMQTRSGKREVWPTSLPNMARLLAYSMLHFYPNKNLMKPHRPPAWPKPASMKSKETGKKKKGVVRERKRGRMHVIKSPQSCSVPAASPWFSSQGEYNCKRRRKNILGMIKTSSKSNHLFQYYRAYSCNSLQLAPASVSLSSVLVPNDNLTEKIKTTEQKKYVCAHI